MGREAGMLLAQKREPMSEQKHETESDVFHSLKI